MSIPLAEKYLQLRSEKFFFIYFGPHFHRFQFRSTRDRPPTVFLHIPAHCNYQCLYEVTMITNDEQYLVELV